MLVHLDGRVLVLDGVEVGPRPDRRGCGYDADSPVARGQCRGRGAGADHAEHRKVVAAAEIAESDRGGRVAGHDQGFHFATRQGIERLNAETPDLVVGSDAVGGASVVAQVHGRLERQPPQDLAEYRQAADTRVEYANGAQVGHGLSVSPERLPCDPEAPRRHV